LGPTTYWERGASAPLDLRLPYMQAKQKLRGPGGGGLARSIKLAKPD
jgi:hypothetical protein